MPSSKEEKDFLGKAAIIVTIIGGLSAVAFNFFAYKEAQSKDDQTAQLAKESFDFQGVSLFFQQEQTLFDCDKTADQANSNLQLFDNLFPDEHEPIDSAESKLRFPCTFTGGSDSTHYSLVAANTSATATPDINGEALPTVYIQISNESQRPDAVTLQHALIQQGYSVPGIELVKNVPKSAQIRFYYGDATQSHSASVASISRSILSQDPIDAVTNDQIKGPYSRNYAGLPHNVIEYWFPAVST